MVTGEDQMTIRWVSGVCKVGVRWITGEYQMATYE